MAESRFSYRSKLGSGSFRAKLERLVSRGQTAKARYLFQQREEKHGASLWNPAYGVLSAGGARDAFTNEPVGV